LRRAALARFVLPALLLAALPAAAQTPRWIAFGDSITQGYGDDPARTDPGYPGRLEALLAQRGIAVDVINAGLGGETTGDALTRVNSVLAQGGSRFLLMEGTNDINAKVSTETITFNLDQLARRAEARGLEAVHVTIIPRLPSANTDGGNRAAGDLAAAVRTLAGSTNRKLVDPFEVFFYETPTAFDTDYLGGSDKLHPNAAGYTLLAQIFADALTPNVDKVPPVLGAVSPADGGTDVPASSTIRVTLYDFGAGIDKTQTKLVINGTPVTATLEGADNRRADLIYVPATPLKGLVTVGINARDLATPPNVVERNVDQFIIAGTVFLAGDIDRNGRVDGADLIALALRFGAPRSNARYLAAIDLNHDGVIDGLDLALLASNFGKSSF
jgi:acyl-CoA thioesterase-1